MSVLVLFMPDRISVKAQPGELLLAVAERGGVSIPTGCLRGACYMCKLAVEGQEHSVLACNATIPNDDLAIFHRYPEG